MPTRVVQQTVPAGAVRVVRKANRYGRVVADFHEVRSRRWHISAISGSNYKSMRTIPKFLLPHNRISIVSSVKAITSAGTCYLQVIRFPDINGLLPIYLQNEVMFLVEMEGR